MGRRTYSRRPGGQFRRATLENTFGLTADICPSPTCRRINTRAAGEKPAENCHACGEPMNPETDTEGTETR